MNLSPEPILDIVRGLSTIASFGIVVTQGKNLWLELFQSPCEYCRGAGMVVCKHCQGSKLRRKFPVKFGQTDNEHPNYQYDCYHCGPYAPHDHKYENIPDDVGTLNIMANLKAAMSNKPVPHLHKPTAGTVPCPECYGQAVLYRHTPDFKRVFRIEEPWHLRIEELAGIPSKKRLMRRRNIEIPRGPPPPLPPIEKPPPKIQGLGGKSLDQLVLPYIDDSDSEEEFE